MENGFNETILVVIILSGCFVWITSRIITAIRDFIVYYYKIILFVVFCFIFYKLIHPYQITLEKYTNNMEVQIQSLYQEELNNQMNSLYEKYYQIKNLTSLF